MFHSFITTCVCCLMNQNSTLVLVAPLKASLCVKRRHGLFMALTAPGTMGLFVPSPYVLLFYYPLKFLNRSLSLFAYQTWWTVYIALIALSSAFRGFVDWRCCLIWGKKRMGCHLLGPYCSAQQSSTTRTYSWVYLPNYLDYAQNRLWSPNSAFSQYKSLVQCIRFASCCNYLHLAVR